MIVEKLALGRIKLGITAATQEEALKTVGQMLIDSGLCKESYLEALVKREKEFPTGLDMGGFGVAIPHTDVTHVNSSGLAMAVLDKPVTFTLMGMDDEFVEVKLICAMAIDNPNQHLDMVEALLHLLRDKSFLNDLAEARSPEDFLSIIRAKENSNAN
ncbi:MAG: PTS sugar transporter subunit IIA [Deltaproteobacteria bacterium]|jgi:PTS system galactitol-specific IIA component|nr:PTS sugar transporter subunit IIA [Deltaproteobacteria bacterium]